MFGKRRMVRNYPFDILKPKHMKNILNRRLWVGLGVSILLLVFILLIARTISDIIDLRYVSLILNSIGWLVWAILSGKLIDVIIINVPFQRAWVTLNLFSKVQRIVTEGYGLKYPWEQVQRDKEIDLIRHAVLIEEKSLETYTSADSTVLYAKWSQLGRPDPGKLDEYIKFKPEDIWTQVRNFTNQHLSDMCATKPADVIMKTKVAMAEELARLHRDDASRSLMEGRYGVIIDPPILADIDQDPEVLKAKQVGLEIKSDGAAAAELVTLAGVDGDGKNNLDFERAMRMVMLRNQNSGVEQKIFTVEGLEGIQHLSVGGMHGTPGAVSGGGGGNGGGGNNQPKKPRGKQGNGGKNP
jgi:hypothetical protein